MKTRLPHLLLCVVLMLPACSRQPHGDSGCMNADDSISRMVTELLQQSNGGDRQVADSADNAARVVAQSLALVQQYALEKEQARHRRERTITVCLSLLLVFIAVLAYVMARQLKDIRRKNAVLSQQIAENISYRNKYLTLMSHPEKDIQVKDKESLPSLETMTDAQLFEFLRVVIVGEKLYLNSALDRNRLMERFGLSKERIGAAFSSGSPYGSITAYITYCRLSYGASLLAEHPEMPVAAVATACGFSNASVFTRNFKQRYTITPTEYREQSQ